jgi:hypothetical protein
LLEYSSRFHAYNILISVNYKKIKEPEAENTKANLIGFKININLTKTKAGNSQTKVSSIAIA